MLARLIAAVSVVAVVLLGDTALAQTDCAAEQAELDAAIEALRDCRLTSSACSDEAARRNAARAAADACEEGYATPAPAGEGNDPAATEANGEQEAETGQATPAPQAGSIAVSVDAPEAAAVEKAAREALSGASVLEGGAVRAARAFLGHSGPLDDAAAEKLRSRLGVERLVVIEVKPSDKARFVSVRAVDAGGTVSRKFGEAGTGADDLATRVKELVASLPALARSDATVAAAPTPTPKPAPTPWRPKRRKRKEKGFGDKGVRVFGGDFGLTHTAFVEKPEGGDSFRTNTTDLTIRPNFKRFVTDGFFLGVTPILTLESSRDDDDVTETDSTVGVLLSAGYLADSGTFHIGPRFTLGFASRNFKVSDGDISLGFGQTGPILGGALSVRAPVGKGGVIGFNVFLEYFPTSLSGDLDGSASFTTFGVSNTIGVWF